MRCAACAHENQEKARFCAQCGARLGDACPACRAPISDGQRFCSECGQALVTPSRAAAEGDAGERRYVTTVFSDLSGFTALNERLDPEEVEEIMGRVKREATSIVERHGGTVNQFVGDEVYSVFGVPRAARDDPRRAVRAALELHQAVDAIGVELAPKIGQRLAMHTGINTGAVLARASESHAGRYLLTGDTVNTAARLLKVASPGEIIVSPETWRQVSDAFEARAGEPVALKGKEAPLVPYKIIGKRAGATPKLRPLIGRAEEMRQFVALAQSCIERGRGRMIVIRGDPGIGKTRLAEEFLLVAAGLGFACHRTLVLDFGAATGRDAVRGLVQRLLAVEPHMGQDARHAAAAQARADGLIGPDKEILLYDLVDAPAPAASRSLLGAMSTSARHRGTLDLLAELVRNASLRKPLVLLVEDIHWADPETLERLSAVAAVAVDNALLFTLTTRFDGDPTAGPWRGALRGVPTSGVDLGPLASEEAATLAIGVSQMPEAVVRTLVERAEGNPLFLEQLLLNAEGAALDKLPGTIQALVLSRMDRLPAKDKYALQAAAVLGQRFTLEALRHVVDSPHYDCAALTEHFLVRPEGAEFLFCHALIRDGARESLAKARRKQFHARAAAWFDQRDPVLAAEHHDRADSPHTARAYLVACEAEAAHFRYDAAVALADRGSTVATARSDLFALRAMRARLLLELGRAQDSIDASRAALECAEETAERAAALLDMAAGMRINDRFDEGLAALDQAQPLAEKTGAPLLLSHLHHLRGNLYFPLGRLNECLHEHRRALACAKEASSLEAEAKALGGLGDAHYLGGRMRSSHEQFRECVELCRTHGFVRLEVTVMHMVGWTVAYLNDMRTAVEVGLQAAELAAKVSHLRSEALSRQLVGFVDGIIRGNVGAARRELNRALVLWRALGAKRFEAQSLQFLAMLASDEGETDRANELAAAALNICLEHGMGFTGPWLHGVLAGLSKEAAERERLLDEGEELLAKGCVSHNHFYFYAKAIDVALQHGRWEAATRYCGKLQAYAAAEPLPWTEFTIARGGALARFGRGERGSDLIELLHRLRDEATGAGIQNALPALETALAGLQ